LVIDVVIGSTNLHLKEIKKYVEETPRLTLHIQIDNIAEIMSSADLALGAGGSTTWERMAVGLPSIVVTIADNQIAFTRDLDRDGYINWIGNTDHVNQQIIYSAVLDAINNPQKLFAQSQKGQQLVSVNGVNKIRNLLINGPNKEDLTIRLAKISDCKLYWAWVNDELVRKNSINQEEIGWEEHQEWFHDKVKDDNTLLLVIESEFGAIGQVRFDRINSHYSVNYSLSRQFRGFGLAKCMLSVAIDYVKQENVFVIEGSVKNNNIASKKVFEQLGFSSSPPPNQRQNRQLSIVILSDRETWMNIWIAKLLASFVIRGHVISWVNELQDIPEGDVCFILSYGKLVKADIRVRNKNNLVVHASDLPKGKGWSPLSWQILEGKNKIVVTLFEAEDAVDSGEIYLQDNIQFEGDELVGELRRKQAEITLNLSCDFINQYPVVLQKSRQQYGNHTFYPKRESVDSQLNPNKTIAEQFNLLRIVDNDRYPAYFEWKGESYTLKIEKST